MIPLLFFEVPVSAIELNKPKIECISGITTILNTEEACMPKINSLLNEKIFSYGYQSTIGTTIVTITQNKFEFFNKAAFDFVQDDFEIVARMPVLKKFSKKVKIQSVVKYKPKISI